MERISNPTAIGKARGLLSTQAHEPKAGSNIVSFGLKQSKKDFNSHSEKDTCKIRNIQLLFYYNTKFKKMSNMSSKNT